MFILNYHKLLRRLRDSNPRYSFPYDGFQDRSIQPLWQASNKMRTVRDSNPWTPPWQGGMITNFTNNPFCVPSRIRTLDHFVNSEVLYRWAKETLTNNHEYQPTSTGDKNTNNIPKNKVVILQNGCISFFIVGKTGLEPATPWSQTKCATYCATSLWLKQR